MLEAGSRIGPYEITGQLGAGGMGEVYKARDTSLGRDVAIKVLPASVANDPERLARFEREAKLLASLSHANIAQIYGLERPSGGLGQAALVMELAAGEDLTVHLQRGPLPFQDALPIATQIAHALEAAHDRGIVHRDLKPANVKVAADGAVKVLDFGLAKALDPAAASGTQNAMNSPTLTAQATAAGIILGTAAYMSPEQARGREADKRADVWAFGVVFFEMLTGTRLFQGETISDTLAAVLRQEIPWSAVPAGTPSEITKLLRRCLERDRKNRLHDIADARIVLEEVARGGAKEETAPASIAKAGIPWWLLGAAAVVLSALAFFGGRWSAPQAITGVPNTVRLVIPIPQDIIEFFDPAVAPDGSFVVFVGANSKGRRLFVQRLDESAPRPIERTEGAILPVISTDGRWVAFERGKRLEKIALDGGDPVVVAELLRDGGPGMAWLPDGSIMFGMSWLTGLSSVSADGTNIRAVTKLDGTRGEIGHWFPDPLPGGRHALITVWKKSTGINDAEIAVLDLGTGQHSVLFKGAEGRYMDPGYIVYYRAGSYHAVRFDAERQTVTGEPVRVLDDAAGNPPEGSTSLADLSRTGTFVYRSGPYLLPRELAWISEGGKTEPLPFPTRPYNRLSLTPDGKRIAVATLDAGRYVIRVMDIDRRADDVLDLPGSSFDPAWHPDGKRLAFNTIRKGDFDVYWMDVTAAAAAAPLLATDFDDMPTAFVRDGSALIVRQSDSDGRYLEKMMPLNPIAAPKPLIPFTARHAKLSPDLKFVAFTSDRSGTPEIYVMPVAGGGAPEKVSSAGGTVAAWSENGRELLYLREPEIIAVPFTVQDGRFRAGAERVWARVDGNYNADVLAAAPDGRVLVVIDRKQMKREIRVIVNWQTEIAKKVK